MNVERPPAGGHRASDDGASSPAANTGGVAREALSKFVCPACGGEAHWNPGKQRLVCPFCGTESDASPAAAGPVVEHDLAAALTAMLGRPRGWQVEKRSVRCQSCRAISVLDPSRQAQHCEFCGSSQLVPYEEQEPAFRPESVLPFVVTASDARDRIRRWYGKLWLAPSALKKKALTDTVHGVYLPYWTFDAQVEAQWTAEAGHFYYTTETYRQNGELRTRQVRHVRWVPAAGSLSHFFDDDLVCASVGVHPHLLRGIEPFPMQALKPYDASYVAGWVVERYQIDLAEGARRARKQMNDKLVALCAAQIPGDTYRNLQVRADFSAQTFKHVLAPVWLLSYDYGRRSFQCVMNGASGHIKGEYPKSPWKIAALVLAVLVLIVIVMSLSQH
jgi:hypothetical protein